MWKLRNDSVKPCIQGFNQVSKHCFRSFYCVCEVSYTRCPRSLILSVNEAFLEASDDLVSRASFDLEFHSSGSNQWCFYRVVFLLNSLEIICFYIFFLILFIFFSSFFSFKYNCSSWILLVMFFFFNQSSFFYLYLFKICFFSFIHLFNN